ncbi:hypothetical protein [Micromonospora sp. MH99]|uniref:hypothetical protein n=1 Tax=Micromonospora sp. MH99 TaxID=1945510 RepID=UPI001F45AC08|nr:hypothetical protein [Micromonospora sp. MH99]MCF0094389.1 hypothetical protein [Micromonospora sp. MH99]
MTDQQQPYPQQPAQPYAQGGPVYPASQQWPGQPYAGPGPDAPPPPPVKSSRTPLIVAAAAFLVVLVLSLGGYAVYDRFIREDPGIAACKAMAEDKQIDGSPKDSDAGDDKLTEAEYREARKIFEDSRYDKIREHGTALMDLLWQVQQLPEDNGGALAFVGPMGTHVSGLQTACADEGYIVKMDG